MKASDAKRLKEKQASFGSAAGVRHQQHRGRPALFCGATRVGNFNER